MSAVSLHSATQAIILPFKVFTHFLNSLSENIQLTTEDLEDLDSLDQELAGLAKIHHSSHSAEMSDLHTKDAQNLSPSQGSVDEGDNDISRSAILPADISNDELMRCIDCERTLPKCHFHLLSLVNPSNTPASNCIGCRFYRFVSIRLEEKGDEDSQPITEDVVKSVLEELEAAVSRFFEDYNEAFPISERSKVWQRIAEHSRLKDCIKTRPLFEEVMRIGEMQKAVGEAITEPTRVRQLADRMGSALSILEESGMSSEIRDEEVNLLRFITKEWEHRAGIEEEADTDEETDSFHSANTNVQA